MKRFRRRSGPSGSAAPPPATRWIAPRRGCAWVALAALGGITASAGAQTPLGRGDIALTGYNSTGADEIAFVLLTDVAAGTAISFTERGWFAAGGFRSGEATFTVVTARSYPCGTEMRAVMSPLAVFDPSGTSAGAVSGSGLALSTAGDQVFVYQGPEPTAADESGLLTALQMNGLWDADATSANTSARPISMTDGVDALFIAPEVDNARYDCSLVSATRDLLAAAVHDAARWVRNDANPFDLTVRCSFSCSAPPTPAPTPTPMPEPTSTATPAPTTEPTPSPAGTATPWPSPVPTPTLSATATPAATPPLHPTPVERVQNKTQQRCVGVLNRGFARVQNAQWAEVVRCVKAFAKGQEPSAAACTAADPRGKVAAAQSGVERAASKRCTAPPDFGPVQAGPIVEHARSAVRALTADLFGEGDVWLASEANERERAYCQRSVLRAVRKCQETHLAEFNRCKKGGLKNGAIKSAASLASCLGADPKDRIALACDTDGTKPDPIRRALSANCASRGVDPASALVGCPEARETELAHSCVKRYLRCRTCRGIAAADALPLDCDVHDDGVANESCVS